MLILSRMLNQSIIIGHNDLCITLTKIIPYKNCILKLKLKNEDAYNHVMTIRRPYLLPFKGVMILLTKLSGSHVSIGIEADDDILVNRNEIYDKIKKDLKN